MSEVQRLNFSYGDIDIMEVMKRRPSPPAWFDRRPELYELILKK
jgi:hypothetical protein